MAAASPEHQSNNDYADLVSFTFSGDCNDDKPILIDASKPERTVSRKRAYDMVARLAGKSPPDSTICLHLANDVLYPVLVLAILASRCRWTGTNTAYTATELEHHFRTSETKYVITAGEHLDTVRHAVGARGGSIEIVMFVDLLGAPPADRSLQTSSIDSITTPGSERLRDLWDLLLSPSHTDLPDMLRQISPSDIAVLMQTSGTTGLPKIAARTHYSMITELQAITDDPKCNSYEVRRLFCTPVFHAFSAPEMLFNALRLGQVSYFMVRYDDSFAQKAHDFGITETFGAPAMLLRLANAPEGGDLLQSLRYVAYGGSPLGVGLRKRFLGMFDMPPRLVPVYGMTEGGWFTTLKYPETDDSGSIGRSIPGYEVRLSKTAHAQIGSAPSAGEVLVRGPQVMQGYLGDPQATADAFEDGWLKTGDIGYFKHGKLYLIDRAKDMMKVNGWQVSPVELQNAIMQTDGVLDAAVFGVGEGEDEHPVACVVRRVESVTAEDVREHMRGCLASYKVRSCEVRFVDAIPRNSMGKVMRGVLREQVSAA
ncbi:hypothetical protein LTR53_004149 [Teratosphaeriaceae sp. CCFEE 6253]|nr:hypothetical protein LTR53_004149 [Teratosphaeriaceae sp. CCFEE 6253]